MSLLAVRRAARNLLHEIRLAGRAAGSRRRFRELRGRTGLKVHLGCGADLKPGWVNVDLEGKARRRARSGGDALFIPYDLRSGTLPLPDGCADVIYSSHFFEHLDYEIGVRLIRDCHRVLRPAGVFRVALPTFAALFRAYLERDESYFSLVDIRAVRPELERGTETLLDQVHYGVYQGGEHKCLYDEEKMCRLLEHIGFEAAPSAYREEIDPGDELRRRYSFYVEARKRGAAPGPDSGREAAR